MRKSATVFIARLLFLGSLLPALACPRLVQAQPAAKDRIQNEVFDDDLLNADLGTPDGSPIFAGHLPSARTRLLRPRTNFLPELYQSVEHL
jgi:hypothetical protein